MKPKVWLLFLIFGLLTLPLLIHLRATTQAPDTTTQRVIPEQKQSSPVPQQGQKAVVDLAFCVDTTGSMSGLIEGAKAKIWSIVNMVASGNPRPTLRIGLVAYRDLNDSYVTRVFDFTSNLETMYSQINSLQADGGGDEPEHVNRALHEAVHALSWTNNTGALKILYLVGDAPPHMDYRDGYDYRTVTKTAARSGIIINTIQCGSIQATQPVWQEVAKLAQGKYAMIDQSGGMAHISSPYDGELDRLSRELNTTYVAYGREGAASLAEQEGHDKDAALKAPEAAAERAAAKAGSLYKNESWDLVDGVRENVVNLAETPAAELPPAMQSMSLEEQKTFIAEKQEQRARLQNQIQDLSNKRDVYVADEREKSGAEDGFDQQVLSTLKEQGKKKGIEFKD